MYVSWSTSELRVRLAPLNRFKPFSKIFYWPFQGGTSFVDLLCFCSVLCLLCLCARLVICALWSPAGKGLTSWLSFVVSTVSWSLSHWYPGSDVVLDCIDSWSLHPYLLCTACLGFGKLRKISAMQFKLKLQSASCLFLQMNIYTCMYSYISFWSINWYLNLMKTSLKFWDPNDKLLNIFTKWLHWCVKTWRFVPLSCLKNLGVKLW